VIDTCLQRFKVSVANTPTERDSNHEHGSDFGGRSERRRGRGGPTIPFRALGRPVAQPAATDLAPAEPWFSNYCGDCWAPCGMTDRGPLCDVHYFSRTPFCDICRTEHSVVLEFGTKVCLSGDCLAKARGGRSDEELAYIADRVDSLAAIVTDAVLIIEAGV
jgi:hypothetical protein